MSHDNESNGASEGSRFERDVERLKKSFEERLLYSIGKDRYSATTLDRYQSLAYAVRDRLIERWMKTQRAYYDEDVKRVYYLSLEFLIGRTLGNSLINLGLMEAANQAMEKLDLDLSELEEQEWDAGLGNGGLGRLAACFLDSMATLGIPAYGYGIHYEYGIFFQHIENGWQKETPDNWLRYGNPWELVRPEYLYPVQFYGRMQQYKDASGGFKTQWIDTENVMAMAYDVPIPGYKNETVNTMRLWAAKSTREFDLSDFNRGDYVGAVENKNESEVISKVLYPNDTSQWGRELRLKQEYFFVSATLQDAVRRYKKHRDSFDEFPDKVAIQLNDTHPAVAIPELMRLLVDQEGLPWEEAWKITVKVFGYTNHTLLPEALERWKIDTFGRVLPRHLQIVYEINSRFLKKVAVRFPGDAARLSRMSIIEEKPHKSVRMGNLAVIGSHSVNGVSALHSDLVKSRLFKDFYEMWPERFNNKTNGVTQRRWLCKSNPRLSRLITETIGDGWINDLDQLKKLIPHADDATFRERWARVKRDNKAALAEYILKHNDIEVDVDGIFDVQIKRIHEYKRQLLNLLHVVAHYHRLKKNPDLELVPRTVIFAGKAAPGYTMAKQIIKLINSVANVVNSDPVISRSLKVVFLKNYGVSLAEKIFPASDLSQQISTAGLEASGTGNMKFALNGALTIGTLDGANVEIMEEVGRDNIFIFGLTAEEVIDLKNSGYRPREYYENNPELKNVIDAINMGYFLFEDPEQFHDIVSTLLNWDQYMLLADYEAYIQCQKQVDLTFKDKEKWTRMSIMNVANMGKFSSDRTIREYAEEIWGVETT
ncbi:MAG: glycogen/starch/alpha-glucan phosphorylase [Desulfobacterales bacterium]|nr:glycogen/starch/alpha-glucan phosphorylase [Desulfobacterales bacterium]